MAGHLPSQDAWTRAKNRYTEDLSHEEKQVFLQASPEMIFYDASAAEKRHGASSTSRGRIDKLQPFIAAIEKYGKALDVYSNTYGLILSPLWGSIRVLLLIAREFGKYFEKLVDMFAQIGNLLPQLHVYEKLFPGHERLIQALSVTYLDVLGFCLDAKAVFRRGQRASSTSLRIGSKLPWKSFEAQFGQHLTAFRTHSKNAETEANLSHMVESADARALALANHLQIERANKKSEHRRLIAMITSIDVEAKHRKLQRLRFLGTGVWFLQTEKYQEWKSASTTSSLCCYGIPGSGKSVLASCVVDDLSVIANPLQAATMYYYCDYADHGSLQTNRILGTLLKQLIPEDEIPAEIEPKILKAYKDGTRSPETSDLMELIFSLMQRLPMVYIVLDGLDECERSVKQNILSFLEHLSTLTGANVHTFVSCRDEDQLLRSLNSYTRIRLTAAALETDIKSFVEGSVRARIVSRQLTIRNLELEHQIVGELVQKSHGMFLWIFFQLNDLCEAISDAMIRQILQDLPDGLVQTYERILLKISNSSLAKQELALRMFSWTICTRRPMETEELQEAVAFVVSDKSWDEEKIPDANLMIETCRGLLVRDQEDGTVRFAHHTVQQYLLTAPSIKSRQHLPIPPFRVLPRSEAEVFVGQVCVTYLCFTDFETQIARRTSSVKHEPLNINKVGGPVRIPTALGVGKAVMNIPYRLFGGKPTQIPLNIDYSTYLTPITRPRSQVPSELLKRYRLLDYIVGYWVEHTKELELNEKFRNLVLHKTLSFEFRPWGLNQHFGSYGCASCPDPSKAGKLPFTSLFHYAAQVGHWSLMEPFVADYCQHEVPIYETLLIACSQGQDGIVRKLTDMIDFDLSDGHAVNAAVVAGHAKVLQSLSELIRNPLLLHRKSSLYDFAKNVLSLLILAATNGHGEVMECILAFPESIVAESQEFQILDLKDERTGWTALFAAVVNGHEHIIRNLLAKGAKIEAHGTTAIHLAAEYGHQNVLRMLLERAAEVPKPDKYGYIDPAGTIEISNGDGTTSSPHLIALWSFDSETELPIHKAARNGHSAVVEMLYALWVPSGPAIPLGPLDSKNGDGYTPANLAARGGHINVLKILIEHGAQLNIETHNLGWTALHSAAGMGYEAVVQLLLENGADLEIRTKDGSTALELAVRRDHDKVIRACLERYDLDTLTPSICHGIVAMIETAVKNEKEAALRVLLDGLRHGLRDFGKRDLEEFLLVAKREKCRVATNELKAMLKEREMDMKRRPLVSNGKNSWGYTLVSNASTMSVTASMQQEETSSL